MVAVVTERAFRIFVTAAGRADFINDPRFGNIPTVAPTGAN